jgi:hypothetical protein
MIAAIKSIYTGLTAPRVARRLDFGALGFDALLVVGLAALFTSTSTKPIVALPIFSDVCGPSVCSHPDSPALAFHISVLPSACTTFMVPGLVT